ncbi:hypothetical protein ACI2KR_08015 [Pseudomonas luteola]
MNSDLDIDAFSPNYLFVTEKNVLDFFNKSDLHFQVEDPVLFPSDAEFRITPNKELVVGYLTPDMDPLPYEFEEGASLSVFRSESERNNFFMQMQDDGRNPFIVEKYEHSSVHYSVIGTKNYHHNSFDVSPCAVYTPSDDSLLRLSMGEITEEDLVKICNEDLDAYSDYCNGNVYSYRCETFSYDAENDAWTQIESDSLHGFVGKAQALADMKEFMNNNYQTIPDEPDLANKSSPHIMSTGPSM